MRRGGGKEKPRAGPYGRTPAPLQGQGAGGRHAGSGPPASREAVAGVDPIHGVTWDGVEVEIRMVLSFLHRTGAGDCGSSRAWFIRVSIFFETPVLDLSRGISAAPSLCNHMQMGLRVTSAGVATSFHLCHCLPG